MFAFLNSISFSSTLSAGKTRHTPKILALLTFIFGCYHLIRSANFDQTREWWYDRHTLDMMMYLNEKVADGEKVKLGVHWMFHPTTLYYKESQDLDFFEELRYSKKILPDESYDYYYVFKSNYDQELTEGYELEKAFSGFAYLLRRKK